MRQIAGYDAGTSQCRTASLALKLGHSLNKCASIKKAQLIQSSGDEKDVDNFLALMSMEWTDRVSRRAHKSLEEGKWNKAELLPLAEDLKILQAHLSKTITNVSQKLRECPSKESHRALSDAVLARLILFNRKRQGEAGKMTLDSFRQVGYVNMQDDVKHTLSEVEKRLASSLKRVVIRGKKGRGVPLLITEEVSAAIDLLAQTREAAGLPDSQYVFTAACGSPLRGCDALKKHVESCGARAPENITSTSLRKHIATVSQVLDLRENELDQLAKFLGHDIAVHRNFYRLPSACTEVTQISKLLIAAEGEVERHRGKRLADIEVDVQSRTRSPGTAAEEDREPDETEEVLLPHEGEEADVEDETQPPRACAEEEKTSQVKRKRLERRVSWSKEEKAAVKRQLGTIIRRGEVPGKADCMRAIAAERALRKRGWQVVKFCAYNMLKAERRQVSVKV